MIRTLECMFMALSYTCTKKDVQRTRYLSKCTKIKFDKTFQQTQHGSIISIDYRFCHPM